MATLRSKIQSAMRQGRKSSSPAKSDATPSSSGKLPAAVGPAVPSMRSSTTSKTAVEFPHLTLSALPPELLRKIASCCDINDVLRLQRCSRALKEICDDALVIEQSLQRNIATFTTIGTPERNALINMVKAQLGDGHDAAAAPTRVKWLSLAVAVRRRTPVRDELGPLLARATMAGRDGTADPQMHLKADDAVELQGLLGVVSTLLVMGYSDVCDFDVGLGLIPINNWAVKKQVWSEEKLLVDKQLDLQLAFCMAVGLLHPSFNPSAAAIDETPGLLDLVGRVKSDFMGERLTDLNRAFSMSWEGLQTRSLQLAGIMAYMMHLRGSEDLPKSYMMPFLPGTSTPTPSSSTSVSVSPPQIHVPLLERGPGTSLRTSSTSWQEWYAGRVRDMVTSIDRHEWYGYYSYELNLKGPIDPAMENIRFKVSPSTSDTTRLSIAATGCRDGVRVFDLVGSVVKSTGMVSLRKQYVDYHHWEYEGVVTPVGILGQWGRREWGNLNFGYFWLWKKGACNLTRPDTSFVLR